ncbi:hypothetical protein QMK19_28410 [Streptomyces sp. H10-C2]|uniref:hypothetical protein n=1 Tax=unclassified Streptomyces TaxID=2593676 RepID=UPI0024B886C4|nr:MULTISPECIES: hypothetical protein [unclassified Streptomyces]MDJ0343882.1 hypothetical protein [Streptomyces sp. PH10-H1]MDJ0373471.1 hypothetical protein [Streptomyces sp. H10-C2]
MERALRSSDPRIRQYAFVAVGDAARLFGGLTPAIYEALRAEGLDGVAENAIRDALTFVPFRDMPRWLKRIKVTSSVRRFFIRRWLYAIEDVESGFAALKNLFARGTPKSRRTRRADAEPREGPHTGNGVRAPRITRRRGA